jgi:HAD superfamily hydrolase (TIGR01490 family)
MPVVLALFDLDHTLIPFDSGSLFTRFLAERGAVDAAFQEGYLAHCRRYAEGTVDMVQMHRFTVGALSRHPREAMAHWLAEFESMLAPHVPDAALRLVQEHQDAGHLCALVTATTRFVAEPFAHVLGLGEVLATEPEVDPAGCYTGEIIGRPCFREHKVDHVTAWLAPRGLELERVNRSWFYSDSFNDLALLQAVTDPVAVDPDPRLRAIAIERGWPVRSL